MAIQFKDYYHILGVPRDAGEEDLRRAFRLLARRYHPDAAGNDAAAENRFKEISEAYEVLGDPQKRQRYDQFNQAWQTHSADEAWRQFSRASQDSNARSTSTGPAFSDFFEELFSPGENPRAQQPGDDTRGDDLEADIWVTLEEVFRGVVRPIELRRAAACNECAGMGTTGNRRCPGCGGAGKVTTKIQCKVRIPQGIKEGAFLRLHGHGEAGAPGGEPGDLYLKVRYRMHPNFSLEAGDLVHELPLAPWEAVLGATVSVPTLKGNASIRIPPGTQTGHKFRIRQHGLPGPEGEPGDLFVRVKVQVPVEAGSRERELWKQLARESNFQPRDN